MGAAATEVDPVRRAVDAALADLGETVSQHAGRSAAAGRGAAAGRLLVVVPGGSDEELAGHGPVGFAEFGQDVRLPPLGGPGCSSCAAGAGGSSGTVAPSPSPGSENGPSSRSSMPTGSLVARYLVDRSLRTTPSLAHLWHEARWHTVTATGGQALGRLIRDDPTPVGLVLVVDGATCHGPKAPRAEDPRAAGSDQAFADALATGDPERINGLDAVLALSLGASAPTVWPLLIAAANGGRYEAAVRWQGAPYGVGWLVASWRAVRP